MTPKLEVIKIIKSQKGLHDQISKLIQNFNKKFASDQNEKALQTYNEHVAVLWNRFQNNHFAIYENETKNNADEYLQGDLFEKTEELYLNFGIFCKEKLSEVKTPTSVIKKSEFFPNNTSVETPVVKSDIRLPSITIPKFDGSYQTWRSFHDLFSSMIHKDPHLSKVQKLHYLKSCVSGEAERLLRQYEVIDANYHKAWEFLEHRYNNKRILVQNYLKRLTNQAVIRTESAHLIKNLVDLTEEVLHELNSLEVQTEGWDPILIHILVQKLPNETLYLWEREQGGSTDLPKYSSFKVFLESRFRMLEALQNTQSLRTPSTSSTNHSQSQKTQVFLNATISCLKCKANNHTISSCTKFKDLSVAQRQQFVKQNKLCMNCLSSKHFSVNCTSKFTCYKCKKRHHTLLHTEVQNKPFENPKSQTQQENKSSLSNHFVNSNQPKILLATALVKVHDEFGQSKILRALIDPGSQTSFITKAACKRLRLKCSNTNVQVTGIKGNTATNANQKTSFEIHALNSPYSTKINTLVITQITTDVPSKQIDVHNIEYIKNLPLADPNFASPGPVDLLLGAEVYSSIVESGLIKGGNDTPTAQLTQLGWILMGPINERRDETRTKVHLVTTRDEPVALENLLKRFWEEEEVPTASLLSNEDKLCEDIYTSTVKREKDGRYEVSLPFKNNEPPVLGKSKHIAVRQFMQLERRFERNEELFKLYKQCIQEYIDLGHMKEIKDSFERSDQTNFDYYYLPHHAVFKESSTTKLRVVFNASSKTSNGKSLNEQLLTGPTIQPLLWCTLLNWRKFKFAFTADIEKMYRMIKINHSQQNYQRIVWRNNSTEPLKTFALTTVTFGTTPAPYLAIRTLVQLARDEEKRFPRASKCIQNSTYVDDVLSGAETLEDALKLQKELIEMLKAGGFNLRKWTSNNMSLLETIPIENRELKTELRLSENEAIKTLGIKWFPASDEFGFSVKLSEQRSVYSKRTILSEVASLYDPLGWLAPIIITSKILIQNLWLAGNDWDQPVSNKIRDEWLSFRSELKNIEQIRIPRWIGITNNASLELHGFCDASTSAYAAVIYLKIIVENSSSIYLLTSKTRVAPTKPVTLPRLELCGAHLLAKLLCNLQRDMGFESVPVYAWTDSLITLSWIQAQPNKWKTYVANRVADIQEKVTPSKWRYVPTKHNPADCASRGMNAKGLLNYDIWWKGPNWLHKSCDEWPKQPDQPVSELEVKKVQTFLIIQENNLLRKFSTYHKLVRVVAYCYRFISNVRDRKNRVQTSYLSAQEFSDAEAKVIQLTQKEVFALEIKDLLNKKPIHRKSSLVTLNPFLDKNSILRVGGRLKNATITYDSKYPIILPKNHFVSKLIVDKFHKSTLHGGPQLVFNTIRTKYWIINAKNLIRYRIRQCVSCFRHNPSVSQQIMGDLPSARVNMALPFQHTGVDFAGPFYVKSSKLRNAKPFKSYICLFVCMAIKAIHLEVVTDLTSDGFLAALRRFVGRRGICSDIYSDCGTNFVGANKILSKDLQALIHEQSEEVAAQLASQGIKWHFNPPSAPHFGGLWEAGVKSVKSHLLKMTQKITLTLEEMSTLLCQIEACVNSRPLTPISNDKDDLVCLTPGHFLIGRHMLSIPEPSIPETARITRRWKHVQFMAQQFWNRWHQEYLHTIQQRTKWNSIQDSIQIGDVVLLKDERFPATKWPLGRITEVHSGPDGNTRVVTVRLNNTTCRRPITKICKIPIEDTHKHC